MDSFFFVVVVNIVVRVRKECEVCFEVMNKDWWKEVWVRLGDECDIKGWGWGWGVIYIYL